MGSQTAREALIGELIGDVDALIARADALRTVLPDAADRSAARLEAAANRLRAELERDGAAHLSELRHLTAEAKAAAWVVDGASRRFVAFARRWHRRGHSRRRANGGAARAMAVSVSGNETSPDRAGRMRKPDVRAPHLQGTCARRS